MVEENAVKVLGVAREHLAGEPEKRAMYPDNSLDAFRHGAILDLRVRFAMELLTHSQLFFASIGDAKMQAEFALDVATELYAQAQTRGLIEPLDSPASVERMQAHAEREAAFMVARGKAQAAAQEEASRIQRAVKGAFNQ